MSADLSDEITAFATVALPLPAFAAAILAGLAFASSPRKSPSSWTKSQRQANERRKAQAARVFAAALPQAGGLVSAIAVNARDTNPGSSRRTVAADNGDRNDEIWTPTDTYSSG